MSLNHKRRIFRSARRGPALPLPSPRVVFATLGGICAVVGGVWLLARPTLAPAQAPATGRVVAEATRVAVVDGTTLRLHDRVVKLDGLAAPARGASCGAASDCGAAATNALARLVQDRAIDCTLYGRDDAGRPLARCITTRGEDVNQGLVAAGWARAEGPLLTIAEAEARSAARGMWASSATR